MINHTLQKEVEGYRLIAGYLGYITMITGVIVLLPLVFLTAYPNELSCAFYFIAPGVVSIAIGYLLSLFIQGRPRGQLHKHQDSVIVAAAWIIAIVVSTMPFVLTGHYNFTQAVFETTSGYSTTGLSVVDVEASPRLFLAFRSIMLFFGGVGLVLVMTSVISDRYGMRLYTAEGHTDRLLPNLLKSARTILAIYTGYIAAGTLLYIFFGMPWFDALNHSIAALSTGGFSTRAQSIGYYKSAPIETVTIVLMLLGSTNFLLHLQLVRGRFSTWFRHCETRLELIVLAFSIPVAAAIIFGTVAQTVPEAFRVAAFQVVSALTTTGFQTVDSFRNWPSSAIFLMIILMLIGGGAGSTAGGIKQARVAVLWKSILYELRSKFNHKRMVRADLIYQFGERVPLSELDRHSATVFFAVYLILFFAGTFIFTLYGYSVQDSAFEFASALGTVGLSIGVTGYGAPSGVLWTATLGMFFGRLEIYVVLMGAARVAKDAADGIHRRRHEEKHRVIR